MLEAGGVGVTSNSRHAGCFDCGDGFVKGTGPVGVSRVCDG